MKRIRDELWAMQDLGYKQFHQRLIPTINPETVIGIRTPNLRALAKRFMKEEPLACRTFMEELPHHYYDENQLHAFMIEEIKDFQEAMERTEAFLPYIDNWATCDAFLPKVFRKNSEQVLEKAMIWIDSDHTYTIRYGIVVLLAMFLTDQYTPAILDRVASIRTEEYYIRMAVAWFFCEALVKQYETALPYLINERLDPWTHNKTIQKCVESFRIKEEETAFLRGLKIKSSLLRHLKNSSDFS